MGGINHYHLRRAEFCSHYKLKGFILVDIGHGFPYMIPTNDKSDIVYGEVYKVNSYQLKTIDMLEGVPYLYHRGSMNFLDSEKLFYYIVSNPDEYVKNKNSKKLSYWEINNSAVLFSTIIDDREYIDEVEKLIFHMRFFDLDRAKTNKQYMKLVKSRSHLKDLPVDSCGLFFRYCIINDIVTEFKPPILNPQIKLL